MNLDLFLENITLQYLINLVTRWGVVFFAVILSIFSILVTKQITLLDKFLQTKGGTWLKIISLFYTAAVFIFLITTIFIL